ncbi:MAG: GIY-YIG nuclease family protein [Anaerolineales bacterium]|jgi:putative endonuclease
MKNPAVYIMASQRHGALYIGVTSNLVSRVWQHKSDILPGFTKKYQIHLLFYYEVHKTMRMAISREKQIKKWNRAWKVRLIEKKNPCWEDLYGRL